MSIERSQPHISVVAPCTSIQASSILLPCEHVVDPSSAASHTVGVQRLGLVHGGLGHHRPCISGVAQPRVVSLLLRPVHGTQSSSHLAQSHTHWGQHILIIANYIHLNFHEIFKLLILHSPRTSCCLCLSAALCAV